MQWLIYLGVRSVQDNNEALHKEAKHNLELDEEAIKQVMSTVQGRRFVNWMLSKSNPLSSSAGKAGFKTNETFFMEGQRNVGIRQIAELSRLVPAEYLKMNQENNQQRSIDYEVYELRKLGQPLPTRSRW